MSLQECSQSFSTSDIKASLAIFPGLEEEFFINFVKENTSSPLCKAAISILAALILAYQESKKEMIEAEKPKDIEWDSDVDDIERLCTVVLASRDIVEGTLEHQALMFKFKSYHVTYDATEVNGKLTPHWYVGYPPGNFIWQEEEIASMTLSPKKINQCAKAISFNGKTYSLTLLNCQVWIQELAFKLGIKLNVFAQLLNKKYPCVAGGINMLYDLRKYLENPKDNSESSMAATGSHLSKKLKDKSNVDKLFKDPQEFMGSLKQ